MKKIKLVGILAAAVMLIFVAVTAYLHEKNADKSEEIFVIPVNNDELLVRRRNIILLKYISRQIC